MIKAIPMEDWLRGCIYHDGRHGYVTLPTDKVHQIANYIQRTRRSGMDGLIDLEVVEADRKTESTHGKMLICPSCGLEVHSDFDSCPRCGADIRRWWADRKIEPFITGTQIGEPKPMPKGVSTYASTEPQTEVDWKQRLCDMYGANRKSFDEAWEKYEADKVEDEPQSDAETKWLKREGEF